MQHKLQKIILILFIVLLFSSAVSKDTAPQTLGSDPIPDSQILQAIQALEQKAIKETQNIQALNERIKQLEFKIAALNSIVVKNQVSKQVNHESIKPGTIQHLPSESAQIIGSIVTTRHNTTDLDNLFKIENLLDPITPYLIPAAAGLLTILLMLIVLRIYKRKRSDLLLPNDKDGGVTANIEYQNSQRTHERNALVAQKLAALRTAVEKGKQRRQQKE